MTQDDSKLKRFYKQAEAVAAEAGGFEVRLDGRAVRTPAKAPLILPGRALAQAIAAEWSAQEEKVEPASMPMMSLACTAIDGVALRRAEVVEEVLRYGETDLLCYRAEQPSELVQRQQRVWQPLLDWAARSLDAPLQVTSGVLAVPQPEDSLQALRRLVEAEGDLELTALAQAVSAAGSLIIGLALVRGQLDPEGAFEAAELDASFQIELWGEDPEATRRRAVCRSDLEAAHRFRELLQEV